MKKSNGSAINLGLNERSKFDSNSQKPAETSNQRVKKENIPTGGKKGF